MRKRCLISEVTLVKITFSLGDIKALEPIFYVNRKTFLFPPGNFLLLFLSTSNSLFRIDCVPVFINSIHFSFSFSFYPVKISLVLGERTKMFMHAMLKLSSFQKHCYENESPIRLLSQQKLNSNMFSSISFWWGMCVSVVRWCVLQIYLKRHTWFMHRLSFSIEFKSQMLHGRFLNVYVFHCWIVLKKAFNFFFNGLIGKFEETVER